MIPEELAFRQRCQDIFAEVASEFSESFTWRMLARSAEEGGPTFRLHRPMDGADADFVFPDTYRITRPSDAEMRQEVRAFCIGFAYPDDEE